jgi:hypothetical protein
MSFDLKIARVLVVISSLTILYSNKLLIVPGIVVLFLGSYNDGFFLAPHQVLSIIGLIMLLSSFFRKLEHWQRFLVIAGTPLLSIIPVTHLFSTVGKSEPDLYFLLSSPPYFVIMIYVLLRTTMLKDKIANN